MWKKTGRILLKCINKTIRHVNVISLLKVQCMSHFPVLTPLIFVNQESNASNKYTLHMISTKAAEIMDRILSLFSQKIKNDRHPENLA